jgi:hypothetical protein
VARWTDGFATLRKMLFGVEITMRLVSLFGVGLARIEAEVSSSGGDIGGFLSIIETSRASGTGVASWMGPRAKLRRVERVVPGLEEFFTIISSVDSEAGDGTERL